MLSWAASPRTRDSSAKLTPQEGLRILWIPLHLVNSELLLKIWQFSLFSLLLLLLPTRLTIKTCHVTNPVLPPVHCQAESLCCELPSAHSHHSLLEAGAPQTSSTFQVSDMLQCCCGHSHTFLSTCRHIQEQPQIVSPVPLAAHTPVSESRSHCSWKSTP